MRSYIKEEMRTFTREKHKPQKMGSTVVNIEVSEKVEQNEQNSATLGFFKKWQTRAKNVKWSNVFHLSLLHILCLVGGLYFFQSRQTINMFTVILAYVIGTFSGLGMSGKYNC